MGELTGPPLVDAVSRPGRDLPRDIAKGEATEKELDTLITRRHEKRKATEGERVVEEVWAEQERRERARHREEMRSAWGDHHAHMYRVHARLAAEHAAKAEGLLSEGPAKGPPAFTENGGTWGS